MLMLVTGGSASGKSEYAEQLAIEAGGGSLIYVATMRPWDVECEDRIERHRNMRRYKGFETVECYENVHMLSFENHPIVLLECISNLLANERYRQNESAALADERILQGIEHLTEMCEHLIVVTNEVFSDGSEYESETEEYIRQLGYINKQLALAADQVAEVVCGIPVEIR